ncbi:dihydroorotase family protein [Actinoallomurus sp. NBC_01490]|uniref:dihydroorotase n=1 Tax=Actinoallomurus sp. NBC_01490 TaxID=2903557 RepID=UPI002E2ED3FB|nr:dihydroorotase family protein [Actinoallomurus sp. NBC_01490]
MQLAVVNGTVVSPEGSRRGHVLVDDGTVVDVVTRDGDVPAARTVVDATGLFVLPGLVDPDVNFREPGLEYKEGWLTGSAAAVCGGVTTVMDMPNTGRPTVDTESLDAKLAAAKGRSYCDYAIKASLVPGNVEEIPRLADAGVCGFRFSMAGTVGAIPALTSGEILDAWHVVAGTGLRCGVHPETREILEHLRRRLELAGRRDPAAAREARPPVAEVEGIARSLALAEATGVRLAFYHVSTAPSIDWVRRAKADGRVDVVAETNPHYCVVDGEDMDRGLGTMLTMHPPVRTREHADATLAALADGTIDVLGTDHSPHTHEEKRYADRMTDIWAATPGWPGLETTVSLMLTAVHEGRLSLERYAYCQSEGPARAWGLWPRKGNLKPGADADITVVDLDRRGEFDESRLHSRHRLTPFHGRAYTGATAYTIVGGEVTARDGELVAEAPMGRFVRPARGN